METEVRLGRRETILLRAVILVDDSVKETVSVRPSQVPENRKAPIFRRSRKAGLKVREDSFTEPLPLHVKQVAQD